MQVSVRPLEVEACHLRITGAMRKWQDAVGCIPFELIGEVTGAGCGTKAGNVEGGSGARHIGTDAAVNLGGKLNNGSVNIEQMRWY